MTYTESNESFVSSILKPYFKEAGLGVPDGLFNEIVKRICTDNDYTTLNMSNAHEYITQKGLSLLNEMHRDGNKNS